MKEEKNLRGKKARSSGQRFERKVRKDLEDKGWVCSKWMNNVDLNSYNVVEAGKKVDVMDGSFLVPAKHKFRGVGIPMSIGTGFPDFICFRTRILSNANSKEMPNILYEVIGVESKSNGQLDKQEKEKAQWLLKNKIFSKILVASKGKKRGEIIYKEFKK